MKANQERLEAINMIRQYELEMFVGKLIILVPNEMENLRVGFGLKIEYITQGNNPVLEYYDIMKQEKFICMGKVFTFTEQKFNGLNKLEPNERIAVFYFDTANNAVDKNATRKEEIEDNQVWAEKVFRAIEEFKMSDMYKSYQNTEKDIDLDFKALS